MIAVGLMCGTSLDGIDAVRVALHPRALGYVVETLAFETFAIAPDLRESVLAMNWEAFRSVLHEGRLTAAGMPMYDDLTDDDMHAIFTYIRRRAREAAQSSR